MTFLPPVFYFKHNTLHVDAIYKSRCKEHAHYLHSGWHQIPMAEYYLRPLGTAEHVSCDVCVKWERSELLKEEGFEWWEDLEFDDD